MSKNGTEALAVGFKRIYRGNNYSPAKRIKVAVPPGSALLKNPPVEVTLNREGLSEPRVLSQGGEGSISATNHIDDSADNDNDEEIVYSIEGDEDQKLHERRETWDKLRFAAMRRLQMDRLQRRPKCPECQHRPQLGIGAWHSRSPIDMPGLFQQPTFPEATIMALPALFDCPGDRAFFAFLFRRVVQVLHELDTHDNTNIYKHKQ